MDFGIGCRAATKKEEADILKALSIKTESYVFNKKTFASILEIFLYCKKHKITTGIVKHEFGVWGDVSGLISESRKTVERKYS